MESVVVGFLYILVVIRCCSLRMVISKKLSLLSVNSSIVNFSFSVVWLKSFRTSYILDSMILNKDIVHVSELSE
jgi:hypothetical protein